MLLCYNPYELLYMYRTGDPHALGMLAEAYGGFLQNIVDSSLIGSPDLAGYRDDLYLECMVALLDAAERYREDMDSSFSTFLTVVARRRIWRYLRPVLNRKRDVRLQKVNFEDAVTETECWYDIVSQMDPLYDPAFFTEYNRLKDDLDQLVMNLKEKDLGVLQSWLNGENYKKASDRLGLSQKAYDGRLNRLRRRVRSIGTSGQRDFMA